MSGKKDDKNGVKPLRNRGTSDGSRTLLAHGEPMVWLTGGGLALAVVMIIGLLVLVLYQGLASFYPVSVERFELYDGRTLMGEVTRRNRYQPTAANIEDLPSGIRARVRSELDAGDGWATRHLVRTGNYELSGEHFDWVSDFQVRQKQEPPWALVVERLTWGRFYGMPLSFEREHRLDSVSPEAAAKFAQELADGGATEILFRSAGQFGPLEEIDSDAVIDACVQIWHGSEIAWGKYRQYHDQVRERREERRKLEKHDVGRVSYRAEKARLAERGAELELEKAQQQYGAESSEAQQALARLDEQREQTAAIEAETQSRFAEIREQITELNQENARYRLLFETATGKKKTIPLAEIVRAYPANQLSATEKAKVYFSRWGEFLAADPREANMEGGVWPAIFGTVVMTLMMSVAVVPFGVLAALYLREYAKAGPMISSVRIAINNLAGVPSIVFGVFGLGFFCYMVGGSIDQMFFEAKLPSPTFGTGGIMWASFTLALLTLPVVIVATEEALSAVPSSMRQGSYACGASKWQTIRRIVLPRAAPGIMTGTILAMARGAGEVAPLMLVGAVKLAPELPVDGIFPYIHPERSFMHLGFHIYDLGFQSQNSEAAKPMVFTTTLLLIAIVAALNMAAILIRNRLRKRFAGAAF